MSIFMWHCKIKAVSKKLATFFIVTCSLTTFSDGYIEYISEQSVMTLHIDSVLFYIKLGWQQYLTHQL